MYKYIVAVQHILLNGARRVGTRGGIDTIGVFNYNYTHDFEHGVPMLTTKKINWKNIIVENLWFLSGEPTIDFLHKHNVHFWDPWVQPDGTVPSAYGNFWRRFKNHVPSYHPEAYDSEYINEPIDQVKWALEKLKANPATRQACITSWDPRNVVTSGLPPCHTFHVLNYHAGRLNLHLTQRSCDTALGLPYNLAGYGGFLLPLYSRFLGFEPGVFGHSIVDMHIYTKSFDNSNAEYDHLPGLIEQIKREPKILPTLKIDNRIKNLSDIDDLVRSNASTEELLETFKLEGYFPEPNIYFKPAV